MQDFADIVDNLVMKHVLAESQKIKDGNYNIIALNHRYHRYHRYHTDQSGNKNDPVYNKLCTLLYVGCNDSKKNKDNVLHCNQYWLDYKYFVTHELFVINKVLSIKNESGEYDVIVIKLI